MNSSSRSAVVLSALAGVGICLATWAAEPAAVRNMEPPAAGTNRAANDKDKQRLREGSRLEEVHGRFDFIGERMAFYPTGEGESFRVLENLSLERIWQTALDSNRQQEWIVSGTLTEFRGSNFLMVTRAVIRTEETKAPLARP